MKESEDLTVSITVEKEVESLSEIVNQKDQSVTATVDEAAAESEGTAATVTTESDIFSSDKPPKKKKQHKRIETKLNKRRFAVDQGETEWGQVNETVVPLEIVKNVQAAEIEYREG